jgi:hypothetical protein
MEWFLHLLWAIIVIWAVNSALNAWCLINGLELANGQQFPSSKWRRVVPVAVAEPK